MRGELFQREHLVDAPAHQAGEGVDAHQLGVQPAALVRGKAAYPGRAVCLPQHFFQGLAQRIGAGQVAGEG